MKIKRKRKEQEYDEEMEATKEEPSFIDKRLKDKEKELDILRERIEAKEREIATLQDIGDSAMYVSDILDMFSEYKKKSYNSCDKLLEDMEVDIINTIQKAD